MLGVGKAVLVKKKPVNVYVHSATQAGFFFPPGLTEKPECFVLKQLSLLESHLVCGECIQLYIMYSSPHCSF